MLKKYRRKKKYIKLRCYRAIKKLKLSFFFAVEIFSVKKIGLTILDYTYEPVRYFFKEFLFLLSTRLNFYNYFSFFLTIKSKVVYFIVKYFGTFFFVLWILYESFFLRFYLVDMPQDDKLPIDRKEISSFWLYRYLPIFFVDSHVFLARPAWRVFNTFRVVLANLRALSQLIYIVYFESLFDFLSKIFLFFFKSFFFVFSFFFSVIFKKLWWNWYLDFVYYFFRLRFFYWFKFVYQFFVFLYEFPIILLINLIRGLILFIPKVLFLMFLLDKRELFLFYKIRKRDRKLVHRKYDQTSNFIKGIFCLFDVFLFFVEYLFFKSESNKTARIFLDLLFHLSFFFKRFSQFFIVRFLLKFLKIIWFFIYLAILWLVVLCLLQLVLF